MTLLERIQVVESIATLLVLIAGAAWAYWKFVRRREHAPRIEFKIDIRFVGVQHDHWIVEVLAIIENKGLVQQLIQATTFAFEVRCLYEADLIQEGGEDISYQVFIPHVIKQGSWLSQMWEHTFIESGLAATYSYITAVPRAASFVLLHGRFDYTGGAFHTADKLVSVPKALGEINQAPKGGP